MMPTGSTGSHTAWRACWLALLLAASGAADAGDGVPLTPSTARFRTLQASDGLSQRSVLAAAQDRDGFVWLGTQDGLNRYDGTEIRVYRQRIGVAGSISGNRITALCADADGVLWAGTSNGLNRHNAATDRFDVFQHAAGEPGSLPDDFVTALLPLPDGTLWIGTSGGLARRSGDAPRFERYDVTDGLPDARVRALAVDAAGRIWVGTQAGLARFDPSTGTFAQPHLAATGPIAAARGSLSALLVDRAQRLWIGTSEGGLLLFDPALNTMIAARADEDDPQALGDDIIYGIHQDSAGRIWVGHYLGVDLVADPAAPVPRFVHFTHVRHNQNSVGSGRVVAMLEDTTGGLWFGSWTGGASLLHPFNRRFLSFTRDTPTTTGLHDSYVIGIAATADGMLRLSTREGSHVFDPQTHVLSELPALRGHYTYQIVEDAGGWWLATLKGLRRYDPRSQRIDTVRPDDVGALSIFTVRPDRGRLWVGTVNGGVYVLDATSAQLLATFPEIGWVSTFAPYDDATMLVGAENGLYWIERDALTLRYRHVSAPAAGALHSANITAFVRGADGREWLASFGDGLYELQLADARDPAAARFISHNSNQGLANDTVAALQLDRAGRLWLATNRGISRFDPATGAFRNYNGTDGVFDDGYLTLAAAALPSGQLAFGGQEGFTVFDPAAIDDPPVPPRPLLTGLSLGNQQVEPTDPRHAQWLPRALHRTERLVLPGAVARSVSLRFASPYYFAPEQLVYRYRLDGFDSDWIEAPAGGQRANYTNLSPGRYVFRVRAHNRAGRADAGETRLDIEILPQWWQTWWARGAVLGMLLAIPWGVHRVRIARLAAQRERLRSEVAARTLQLSQALDELKRTQRQLVEQEKMASLGSLVAGVAHEVNTPIGIAVTAASTLEDTTNDLIKRIESGALRRQDMYTFRDTAAEGLRLILGSLDRAHQLVASFKQVAVDQSSEQRRKIDLRATLEEILLALQPSYRRTPHQVQMECPAGIRLDTFPGALFQIITNLVSNSLLHAFADQRPGRIEIVARVVEPLIELRYRDDGAGMAPAVAARAFEPFFTTRRGCGGSGLGLHLVYNLVTQLLGGTIELQSTPGSGTEFTIRLPRSAPQRVPTSSPLGIAASAGNAP